MVPVFNFRALVGMVALSPAIEAKQDPAAPTQDQIEVAGHIASSGSNGGAVTRLLTTQHYSRSYLYVERAGTKEVTMIDVTKANQLSILAEVPDAPDGVRQNLVAVAGSSALVAQTGRHPGQPPTFVQIMDFADGDI